LHQQGTSELQHVESHEQKGDVHFHGREHKKSAEEIHRGEKIEAEDLHSTQDKLNIESNKDIKDLH